jgi:hypothetical protein
MQYTREGHFSHGTKPLKAKCSRSAIDYMAQKFKASARPDPQVDASGSISILLARQTKGCKNLDPSTRNEEVLPVAFYHCIVSAAVTDFDHATANLCITTFFFAMRSCEYTKTLGHRRTKTLTLDDFRFFLNNKQLAFDDLQLHLAEVISITFRF